MNASPLAKSWWARCVWLAKGGTKRYAVSAAAFSSFVGLWVKTAKSMLAKLGIEDMAVVSRTISCREPSPEHPG